MGLRRRGKDMERTEGECKLFITEPKEGISPRVDLDPPIGGARLTHYGVTGV
jgi:hypothetical protein